MQPDFQTYQDSAWKPDFIDPSTVSGQEMLSNLLADKSIFVHDLIESQVGELLKSLHPKKKLKGASLKIAVDEFFKNTDAKNYGVWVYYPWSRRLIHLLPKEEFIQTRISPNNPKITLAEQEILRGKKVGVVGLSVGQSISLVLAMERICGEIRIADFDTLELANLNRIRSGLHTMGLNKTVMVAREIAEIDPFFTVRCYPEGLIKENIDSFFHDHGDLDLIVDECDSIDIKILLREKARSLGIPVVMDMSDRGTIDIERFDLEPTRPILHGWIDHLDTTRVSGLTNEEKVPYMLPIFGMDTLGKRLKASMVEIGETIHTWPQLATSVAMGGALAADTVRRIFLDQFHDSGRYFIDLDQLIQDKHQTNRDFKPENFSFPFLQANAMITAAKSALNKLGWERGDLKDADIETLISLAAMAPSAGNNQPWKWLSLEGHLFLFHEKARSYSWTDYDDSMAYLALGACSENLRLAASRLNYVAQQHEIGENQLIAAFKISFQENIHPLPLAEGIELRCSNRKKGTPELLPQAIANAIEAVVSPFEGMQANIFAEPSQLEAWAQIIGRAEKLRLLHPQGHYEFFNHEVRWNEEEVTRTRDGLDIETLELTPSQLAGMQVASDAKVMDLIREWKAGDGLEKLSADAVRASSALCLISCDKTIPDHSLILGSAIQSAWIKANLNGWSVHPVSAPLFFVNRLEKPNNLLNSVIVEEILELKAEIDKITSILHSRRGVFLFRLSWSGEPTKRAIRLLHNEILIRG